MIKPKYWRWDSSTGKLTGQEKLSCGFSFDGVEFERKPWISWIMAPMVNLLTIYVWLKKKWWQRFKGKKPPVNTMWFDGLGKYAKIATEGHGNWLTLSTIYNEPDEKHFTTSWLIDQAGYKNANCQAVRNRLKIAKRITAQYIANNKGKNILCLACGSAESIMPSLEAIESNGHHLTLVDHDCQVVEYLENAHSCSKNGFACIERQHTSEFLSRSETLGSFDFIEMIGALEYMDDPTVTKTIQMCIDALKPEGILVTSNLRRNSETPFVKWVIDWEMKYRTLDNFFGILKGGGNLDGIEIITEPLGIHNIAVFKKNTGEHP